MIIFDSLKLIQCNSFLLTTIDYDLTELLTTLKYAFYLLLINLISYIYVIIKFYKVLCYSKLTFEWLPMINPYIWPFSFFQILTAPYFALWAKILPMIKFDKTSVEVSAIIGLEALNSVLYLCVHVFNEIIILLNLENTAAQV